MTWQGRQYQAYPIEGSGFEMNGKGSSARPSLTVSNLFGLVTGMAEDLAEPGGCHGGPPPGVCAFSGCGETCGRQSGGRPRRQELTDRWVVEQMSELTAMTASFVSGHTDGGRTERCFPGRIMLANTCMWDYRGDECGYNGPAVADEFEHPTTDIRKDRMQQVHARGVRCAAMVAILAVSFPSINISQ
ncbi:phage minor tail protein L [Escherichia coli]|uniref:phage minor tail protein L n=1 Tax=Escherichia coli TaxID=562 RepID=UPI0030F392D0